MYKIERSNLPALFSLIHKDEELFLPIKTAGKTNFGVWDEDAEVDLDTLKTVKSPKDVFFPQSETLYTCKKEGKKLTVTPSQLQSEEFVVFGMKACDVEGFHVLDQVFLTDPLDTFYAARREHGTIVSLACNEPEISCFCRVFGIDCRNPKGDVVTTLVGDTLYWKPVTEKGEKLTEKVKSLLTLTEDEKPVEEQTAQVEEIIQKLPYMDLSLEGWDGNATNEKFNSALWDELYKPCLACGTCTFVCPTCQCYDIKDYNTGNGVQRFRCWDSCMYSDFTMMAAGNNRKTQKERFRQRFMHKLVYFPANNDGMYSCVGCGRCVDKCPQSLNIIKVVKAFQKEKEEGGKAE